MSLKDRILDRLAIALAPHIASRLIDDPDESTAARLIAYEAELKELRTEVDELRRDNLRIAELYDLVFARLKGSGSSGA